jgi:long-chain fatty acid transport protein
LRLPASLLAGVAVTPVARLRLEADAVWTRWSVLRQVPIELEEPALSAVTPKEWRDVWSLRVGGEYGVTEAWAVRAGFAFEPTPSPEETQAPDLPDTDRVKLSVGGGYQVGSLRVDAAYLFEVLKEQRSTFPLLPGAYGGSAHVFGVTLGYGW